ncbi:MAG: hypothetical protein ACRCWD_05240 [Culicoidibacterales bacterium]
MKELTITKTEATTSTTHHYFDLLCLLQWKQADQLFTYLDSPHDHTTLEYFYYTFSGTLTYSDEAGILQKGTAGSIQLVSPLALETLTYSDDYQGLICGFDPELMPTLTDTPLFQNYFSELLPLAETDEISEKTLLGPGSPAKLALDCHLYEITLEPHTTWKYQVEHGRHCGLVVTIGDLQSPHTETLHQLDTRFYSAISDDHTFELTTTEHTHFFLFDLVAQR